MSYNSFGFLILSFLALAAALLLSRRPRKWIPETLLITAVVFRIIGSTLRYEVLFRFYHGTGDAVRYFADGQLIAQMIRFLEWPFLSFHFWFGDDKWWGTPFMVKLSGIVLSVIGPTLRGEFLVFSIIAFVGLYAMALAFKNLHPGPEAVRYAAWIWLFPSLWFWPSSVGKEAITILALGIVTLGYVGRDGKPRWPVYLSGLALAFWIRPHVAFVITLATMAAHWFGEWEKVTPRRLAEALGLLILVSLAFSGMAVQFGFAGTDLEGVSEFVSYRAQQTLKGGSNIGSAPIAGGGIPMAFINTWMRPFLWEAHNATSLLGAVEVLVFLGLVWYRRRTLGLALRGWRHDRLLRFAFPMAILYTLLIGLTFGNLGILARQKTPIIPFVFIILFASPPIGNNKTQRLRDGVESMGKGTKSREPDTGGRKKPRELRPKNSAF